MLVVTRRETEEVVINGNIRLRVLSIHGNRVKLGFDAPEDIPIQRGEIFRTESDTKKIAKEPQLTST